MSSAIFIDVIVVCVILLSGLLAWFQGLVKEIFSIASWLGAIFVTSYAFGPVLPLVREHLGLQEAAVPLTIAGLFIGSLIIFTILSRLIVRIVHGAGAGALDRTLGFVFGLMRGALIVIVLYMAAGIYVTGMEQQPRWFANARTLHLTALVTKYVITLLPEDMRKVLPTPVMPERRVDTGQAPKPGPSGKPGYSTGERQGLNRLFEGTNQGK